MSDNPTQHAEYVVLCGRPIDSESGCYCELAAEHGDAPCECACGVTLTKSNRLVKDALRPRRGG
jgi:hypothetical protein